MDKVEIRAVNKFLCKKGMSHKEINADFMDTLRMESPSYSTVKKWVAKIGQ
jgi:transposase